MTVKVTLFACVPLFISFPEASCAVSILLQQLRRRSFRIVGFARFHYLYKLLRAVMPYGIRRSNLPADELLLPVCCRPTIPSDPHQHQIRQNSVRRFQRNSSRSSSHAPSLGPPSDVSVKRDQPVERDRVRMCHTHTQRPRCSLSVLTAVQSVFASSDATACAQGIRRLRHLFPTGTAASRKKNRRHTYQYRCFSIKIPTFY